LNEQNFSEKYNVHSGPEWSVKIEKYKR